MGISYHVRHARQRRNFFRRALRVTSGHNNLRGRIGSVDFADGIAGLGVRSSSHGASVQHDKIRGGGIGRSHITLVSQLALDGGTIGLGRAAPNCSIEKVVIQGNPSFYLTIAGKRAAGQRQRALYPNKATLYNFPQRMAHTRRTPTALSDPKLSVVIPVYNEKETIFRLNPPPRAGARTSRAKKIDGGG